MKTIKNWSDINLNQYIKLHNLYKEEGDEIELIFKRLMILFDLTYDEVENINITDYNKIKSDLIFMNSEPNQTNFKETLEIDGVEFKFINLDAITLGEWVDLDYYQKDFINNIHRILAILYKPQTKVDNVSEFLLEKMDVETGLSAFFFFYLFGLSCIPSDSEGYSQLDKAMMEMQKAKSLLEKETSIA